MRRHICGATYVIAVKNTVRKGTRLTVDGVAIESNLVPYPKGGSTVQVTATV